MGWDSGFHADCDAWSGASCGLLARRLGSGGLSGVTRRCSFRSGCGLAAGLLSGTGLALTLPGTRNGLVAARSLKPTSSPAPFSCACGFNSCHMREAPAVFSGFWPSTSGFVRRPKRRFMSFQPDTGGPSSGWTLLPCRGTKRPMECSITSAWPKRCFRPAASPPGVGLACARKHSQRSATKTHRPREVSVSRKRRAASSGRPSPRPRASGRSFASEQRLPLPLSCFSTFWRWSAEQEKPCRNSSRGAPARGCQEMPRSL
mmetsp:Transcript_23348/g.69531  ORF Transcript_23348/g.69531 Transcript_23348/m.69531 type:complete len:260 (-) Transcript_23348:1676-2455(-)